MYRCVPPPTQGVADWYHVVLFGPIVGAGACGSVLLMRSCRGLIVHSWQKKRQGIGWSGISGELVLLFDTCDGFEAVSVVVVSQ